MFTKFRTLMTVARIKMASEGESTETPNEDITKGDEPGASRNSIILPDSYEDLALYLEEQLKVLPRPRLPSGTIKELKKLKEESNPDDTSNDSLTVSVSSRDSSNRATPSREVTTQVMHCQNLQVIGELLDPHDWSLIISIIC